MKSLFVFTFGLMLLTGVGCGSDSTQTGIPDVGTERSNTLPVSLDTSCAKDTDCVITTKIYHPCTEVYAVAGRVTDEEIAEINDQLYKYYEGRKYDCPVPQDAKDYTTRCEQGSCKLVNTKYQVTK